MTRILNCTCCGGGVVDTPEGNADYYTRGQDDGYGRCNNCYGSTGATIDTLTLDNIKTIEERLGVDELWEVLGWAEKMFYQARFSSLAERLNDKNSAKFESFPTWKKMIIIQDAVTDGMMI